MAKIFGILVVLVTLIVMCAVLNKQDNRTSQQESAAVKGKAYAIPETMNSTLNKGYGYTCKARAIDDQLVQSDLIWPSGTNDLVVLSLTKELANKSAEIRLASTIYVAGYIEGRRVCEWK